MTPMQAIQSATSVAAFYMGMDRDIGSVQEGKLGDLIAVRGNPLESIDALRDVQFVMKDGIVFKQNGIMTPEKFFNGGPVRGARIR